jgi:predicted AlkP superfamily pyrophosphatase or phosphodiesterase
MRFFVLSPVARVRARRPFSTLFALAALGALALAGCMAASEPASPALVPSAWQPAAKQPLQPEAQPAAPRASRPRLAVVFVIDGLPERQMVQFRSQFAPDGFARFLDRGASFSDARYGHAFTVTAAGHATLLTGASPERTGIVGNDWLDQATGAPVYCTSDSAAVYIGNPTAPLDGTSPKNLKVEALGDVLRRLDARSKVIAVSGKDRGAILPAGRTGTPYMYMGASGQFASTTHYMRAHPAWVDAFNAQKPADKYFNAEWKAVLPEAAYAASLPDNQPWYASGGALPMRFGAPADAAPGPRFYASLVRGPFIDAMSLDFARAAIDGEQLGKDDAPDILAISLSGHDYVNHAFSAESRLSQDHLLQLDRMLQSFFADLDARVGKDHYVAVLTADHGFMPAPEYTQGKGQSAGRLNGAQLVARLNAGLEARFGPGKWVRGLSASSVLLDRGLLQQKGSELNAVAEEARMLLLAEPGIAAAYTRRELETGSAAGAPLFAALKRSWHADVSGDVQYGVKPNWMFGSNPATHGSPYAYDTQVPLFFYGPGWVRPGRVAAPVDITGIAPTLARLLRIPAPAGSQGKVLPLPGLPAS